MPAPGCGPLWGKSMPKPPPPPPGGERGTPRGGQPSHHLDDWLTGHVAPLPPPPGTLERIRKRARRRKLSRAAGAAAGAAAVAVAIAIIPRLALSQLHPTISPRGVAVSTLPQVPDRSHGSRPLQARSSAPVPTLPPAVPPNFAAASVTFVGTETGFTMGQAGMQGQCTGPNPEICTSLARTDDYGRTWHGVPAPVSGPPDGASGVSQLRFLNTRDGWVFGPELWATHDGGHTWTQLPTHGLRVTSLETAGTTAYAVLARCRGSGAAFAAHCTSFTLYSAQAGSDDWQPVPGARGLTAGGAPSAAELVLTGGANYLLSPGGVLLTAPAGGSRWRPASGGLLDRAPCEPAPPGRPGGALVAAQSTQVLALMCPASGRTAPQPLYVSTDSGKSWQLGGQGTLAGTPASLAATPSGMLVAGTSRGISISTDSGGSWGSAQVAGSPRGGFSYVGMTTNRLGVAVPADLGQHALWFTYDGGRHWQPSAVQGG